MRLKPSEAETIRAVVHALDADAKVYLFGSRVNEAARGGDIDLLVLSRTLSFRDKLKLKLALSERLGEQRIDSNVDVLVEIEGPATFNNIIMHLRPTMLPFPRCYPNKRHAVRSTNNTSA